MSLTVHYVCTYYPQWAHENLEPRSQAQWNAFNFCRAVKFGTTNARIDLPLKSGTITIDSGNVQRARRLFGSLIVQINKNSGLGAEVFVPTPSKDSYDTEKYRSLRMLSEALEGKTSIPVAGAARFATRLRKAHQGGPRSKFLLQLAMRVYRPPKHLGEKVVLIDDLVTTGSSLLATRSVLEEAGYDVVAAIVCGRTLETNVRAFGLRNFPLPEEDEFGII